MSYDVNALPADAMRAGYGAIFAAGLTNGKQRIFFERGAVIDAEKSEAGGTYPERHPRQGEYRAPVYRDTVMIVLVDPEPPYDKVMREATEQDYAEYAADWERSQKTMHLTPIAYLPTLTPAKREMCAARGIFWVEQIAEKAEETLCDELKALPMIAKQYLMIAQGQKPRMKLAAA